jgi:hypothetical protein
MPIPCQIQYNYIGKIETFIGDTFYILEKLNLTQYLKRGTRFFDATVDDLGGFVYLYMPTYNFL